MRRDESRGCVRLCSPPYFIPHCERNKKDGKTGSFKQLFSFFFFYPSHTTPFVYLFTLFFFWSSLLVCTCACTCTCTVSFFTLPPALWASYPIWFSLLFPTHFASFPLIIDFDLFCFLCKTLSLPLFAKRSSFLTFNTSLSPSLSLSLSPSPPARSSCYSPTTPFSAYQTFKQLLHTSFHFYLSTEIVILQYKETRFQNTITQSNQH